MTVVHGHTFSTQHTKSTSQIKELQDAIRDNTHKLAEVQQKKLRAEEEIMQCTKETERRLDLMMGKSGVVDLLQQLGELLQEERHLSEQLSAQASADRNQRKRKGVSLSNKVKSLTAEILEVKQCLAEAKARNTAAQALIHCTNQQIKEKSGQTHVN